MTTRMASADEVNSDMDSPSIIRPEVYKDLGYGFNLEFLTAHETSAVSVPGEGIRAVDPTVKDEYEVPWRFSEAEHIEISDSEQNPFIISAKKNDFGTPWKFLEKEFIELSDSEQNLYVMPIKEEPMASRNFSETEPVKLSDSEHDIPSQTRFSGDSSILKGTNHENYGEGADQSQDLSAGLDYGQEAHQVLDQEPLDMNPDVRRTHSRQILDGQSKAERQNNRVSKLQRFQERLAEHALGKSLVEGADKLQKSPSRTSGTDAADPNDWMNATLDSDTDPGARYVSSRAL